MAIKDDQHPTYVVMLCKHGASMLALTLSGMHVQKNGKNYFEINAYQCLDTPKLYSL